MMLLCGDARLVSALLSSRHTHAGPVSKTECRSLYLCGGRYALCTALAQSSTVWHPEHMIPEVESSGYPPVIALHDLDVVSNPWPIECARELVWLPRRIPSMRRGTSRMSSVSRRDEQLASLRVLRVLAPLLKIGANTMPAQHLYALEGYRGVSYYAILALWQRYGCTVLLRRAFTGRRSHMTHCPPM